MSSSTDQQNPRQTLTSNLLPAVSHPCSVVSLLPTSIVTLKVFQAAVLIPAVRGYRQGWLLLSLIYWYCLSGVLWPDYTLLGLSIKKPEGAGFF